jgi:hypothetical protein
MAGIGHVGVVQLPGPERSGRQHHLSRRRGASGRAASGGRSMRVRMARPLDARRSVWRFPLFYKALLSSSTTSR